MRKYYIVSAIITTVSVIVALALSYVVWLQQEEEIATAEVDALTETREPEAAQEEALQRPAPPVEQHITIGIIGDILLHDSMLRYGDYNFAFREVKERLESVDLLIANLESLPGGRELGLSGYPVFNSPTEIVPALAQNGVDFISMANNHVLDRGETQLQRTIDTLEAHNLPYTGAYRSPEDADVIRIENVDGVSVAILAYTYGTNVYGKSHPNGKTYTVNVLDEDRVLHDIERVRDDVDVVVLSLHWGDEYKNEANEEQRRLSERFTEAGADVIFGHHPHVLQPFDYVNGKPVFYSVGNFYSGMPWAGTNIGGIGRVSITKTTTGDEVDIAITDAHFYPTVVVRDVTLQGHQQQAFRIRPLQSVGSNQGYDVKRVETLVGLPSWE